MLKMFSIKYIVDKGRVLFRKGAFHVFVGNFVNKFIGLFGSIFIVRLLTKTDYGTLGYVENLYSYGYIFSGLGLSAATLRYGVIISDKNQRKGVYDFLIKGQWLINLGLMGIIILFAWLYPHPSQYAGAAILLTILVLGLPFQDMQNTNLLYERSQLENKRYMYLSVFASVLSVFFRVLGSGAYGVRGTISFKVFAEIIACIVISWIVYNTYFKSIKKQRIEKSLKKEIFVFAINNMIANGIWILFMLTDTFLIGRLLNSPDLLADYKVAYVLPSNLAIVTSAVATFVTPYFVKNEKDFRWVKNNYFKTMICNLALVGSLAIVLFLFAPQFILLLYGNDYLNIVPVMRALLIAHLINSGVKTITASLLTAMGYARENVIISMEAFILQISLATYVLPRYGIMGLAINNIFVYLLMAMILVAVFIKKFGIVNFKRKINF